jgi:hypothetical protein
MRHQSFFSAIQFHQQNDAQLYQYAQLEITPWCKPPGVKAIMLMKLTPDGTQTSSRADYH